MSGRKPVNLALQGGGAHGAYTWGVLDRLLADDRLLIEGISGTSAGAMNAVVLADGLRKGGVDGGRRALREFWRGVSDAARLLSPIQRTPLDRFMGNWNLDYTPGYLFLDLLSRLASPYDFNPLNLNPLHDLLADLVDFDSARRCERIKLFISATNVRTGRIRVFGQHELNPDVVMASACLPLLFQAVEVDGEPYWDGGYSGNPALFPLFRHCASNDIVLVQINPIETERVPTSARDILNRINEITFNASLLKELRAVDFVTRLLDEHRLDPARYQRMLIHRIATPELDRLNASSKLNPEWAFLEHLHAIGWRTAEAWLEAHYDSLGRESTIDSRKLFQGDDGGQR